MNDTTLQYILVTICFALSAWALKSVVRLSERIAAMEGSTVEKHKAIDKELSNSRDETERRFIEIRSERLEQYKQTHAELKDIHSNVTALHKRMDGYFGGRQDSRAPI